MKGIEGWVDKQKGVIVCASTLLRHLQTMLYLIVERAQIKKSSENVVLTC